MSNTNVTKTKDFFKILKSLTAGVSHDNVKAYYKDNFVQTIFFTKEDKGCDWIINWLSGVFDPVAQAEFNLLLKSNDNKAAVLVVFDSSSVSWKISYSDCTTVVNTYTI